MNVASQQVTATDSSVTIAPPRRPLPGNDVTEMVYARLLGRQQAEGQ